MWESSVFWIEDSMIKCDQFDPLVLIMHNTNQPHSVGVENNQGFPKDDLHLMHTLA